AVIAARAAWVTGPMKPGWLKKWRILSMRGAPRTCARAASMSSGDCRQLEEDPYADVTNAIAWRTPSEAICATLSAKKGGPVRVPRVGGGAGAGRGEVLADGGERVAALLVERAPPAERVVVAGHLGEPVPRHPPAPGDVLQERHHVSGALRAAERHQQ